MSNIDYFTHIQYHNIVQILISDTDSELQPISTNSGICVELKHYGSFFIVMSFWISCTTSVFRFWTFPLLNNASSRRRQKFKYGLTNMLHPPLCTPSPPHLLSYFLTPPCLPSSTDGQMTCCFLFLPNDLHSPPLSAQLINLTLCFFSATPSPKSF